MTLDTDLYMQMLTDIPQTRIQNSKRLCYDKTELNHTICDTEHIDTERYFNIVKQLKNDKRRPIAGTINI